MSLRHRDNPPKRFIAYIPAANVAKIKEPSIVISIKGAHGDRPEINTQKHHVFKLDFDVGDWAVECEKNLQEQQVIDLLAFLESHKDSDRDVYVHCTEGRIRSYSVATVLRQEGMFMSARGNPLLGPGGCLDRPTCNTMNAYFEKLEQIEREKSDEEEEAGSSGSGTTAVEHVYTQ